MHVPVVLLGICDAREVGGVHDTDVALVFVAIVPLALPKEYVRVCVNEEEAREILIVPAEPISVAGMEMLDVRGMVCRATVWLPLTLHPLPPFPSHV